MACATYKMPNGARAIVCFGRGRKAAPRCKECGALGEFLCDFPEGRGNTCDKNLCRNHAHEVAADKHYCSAHLAQCNAVPLKNGAP